MKVQKKILIAVFTLMSSFIYSQESNNNEQRLKERLLKISTELNLSEEQQPEFKKIAMKYMRQTQELKNSSESKKSKFKKNQELVSNRNKEMEILLSEKQYKSYLKLQKKLRKEQKKKQ
jgi:hypothetical protein